MAACCLQMDNSHTRHVFPCEVMDHARLSIALWDTSHRLFFTPNFMEIRLCSNQNYHEIISTKFCTCHDSYALMASAKFSADLTLKYFIIRKYHYLGILIVHVKSLVKWASESCLLELSHFKSSHTWFLLPHWTCHSPNWSSLSLLALAC